MLWSQNYGEGSGETEHQRRAGVPLGFSCRSMFDRRNMSIL